MKDKKLLVDKNTTKLWKSLTRQHRALCTFIGLFGNRELLTADLLINVFRFDKKSIFFDTGFSQKKVNTAISELMPLDFFKIHTHQFSIGSHNLAHLIIEYQSSWENELNADIFDFLEKFIATDRSSWYISKAKVFEMLDTLSFYRFFNSEGAFAYSPLRVGNEIVALSVLTDSYYVDALPSRVLKNIVATQGKHMLTNGASFYWCRHAKSLMDTKDVDGETELNFVVLLLEIAVRKGDTELLNEISSAYPDTFEAYVALGWSCFITGQYDKAAAAASFVAKKMKNAYSNDFYYPISVWLLRVMTDIQTKAESDEVRKHLNYLSNCRFGLVDEKKLSEALPSFLDHKIGVAEQVLSRNKFLGFASFFKVLMLSWMGDEKVSDKDLLAAELAIHPEADYLQRELTLIKQRKLKTTEQQLAVVLRNEKKNKWAKPLLHFFTPLQAWEAGLSALMRIGGEKAATNFLPRIIWLIDFRNGGLVAKEQKFSKNGWTSGREVSQQSIAQNVNLDSFDKAIVYEFSKRDNQSYYYHRYLGYKEVILALVGHPRLFLADSPETQVYFVDEPVTISIKDRDEANYEFGFNISFTADSDFVLAKETPTKYRVYKILKEHKEVLLALGKERILIPKSAKELLEKVINHVGSLVEVQSSVGDMQGSIPEIEADATIFAQLVPIGQGFILELFVRPLPPVPTYCIAGKGDANLFGLLKDKSRTFCIRNLKKEVVNSKKVVSEISFLKENKPNDNAWLLDSDQACLSFLADSLPLIEKKQLVVEWPKGEKYRVVGEAKESSWNIKVSSGTDWFSLQGSLKLDEENVLTMQELVEQVNRNGRFIQLNSGNFMSLTKAFETRIRAIAGLTQTNRKTKEMTLHTLAAGALNELLVGLPNTSLSSEWIERIERIGKLRNKKYPLPKGLNAALRNYQIEGFAWLSRLADWGAGACLADDMGLGKTLQVQAILLKRASDGPALVVAPASVVRNWINEINKFTPSLTPLLFSETDDRQKMIKKAKAGQVIIVTYNLLQREADLFASCSFSTIVLDEAQAIKNAQTKRSDVVKNLKGDFKIVTTGTPIENHLGELWSLFEFINPGYLGTLEEFNQRFVGPIERDKDENRRNDLRRLIQPFMLRRLKKDHLKELPGKTEILLSVELSKDELAFYEALRRDSVRRIEEMSDAKPGEKGLRVLAELTRLRQACCNPRLIDEESTLPCSKLRLFDETITELIENGHKALVFSQFVTHLSILREHLDQRGISYQYLDGSTPSAKRQENIDAFQRGEGNLFLISLKAGGAGINLTAADYVIHMDPWWNPAVEDQATDRAHRMGQSKPVTVYRLITAGTIEEKIVALHDQKRDLADSLLEGTDISARLNTKDLIDLMKLG